MNNVTTVGIELAKNVFSLHGVDGRGREVLRRTVRRGQLLAVVAQLPGCLIGLEACSGAHEWARQCCGRRKAGRRTGAPAVQKAPNSEGHAAGCVSGRNAPVVSEEYLIPLPAKRFVELLCGAIRSGRGQVQAKETLAPGVVLGSQQQGTPKPLAS